MALFTNHRYSSNHFITASSHPIRNFYQVLCITGALYTISTFYYTDIYLPGIYIYFYFKWLCTNVTLSLISLSRENKYYKLSIIRQTIYTQTYPLELRGDEYPYNSCLSAFSLGLRVHLCRKAAIRCAMFCCMFRK